MTMILKRCKVAEEYLSTIKEEERENIDAQQQNLATESERVNNCWLLELPLPLIHDIFIMLPAETILCCRCVCKKFLEILTDPHFVETHLTKARNKDNGLVIQDGVSISDNLLVYDYKLELEKPPGFTHINSASRPCQTLGMPTAAIQFYNSGVTLVGSCNGLLCIRYHANLQELIYYVCNPILGEFLALPWHARCEFAQPSGFGFCPKTRKYKILRFFTHSLCKIHTVGTYYWRTIDDAPYPRSAPSFDSSLNGNLHWIVEKFTPSRVICSFNLETEKFSYLPPPSHFDEDTLTRMVFLETGLLGGTFRVSYLFIDYSKFEVCVMKDYGVKESWTKDYSIDIISICRLRGWRICFVIKLLDNGDLFLNSLYGSLVCYNLRTGTVTAMLNKKVMWVYACAFVPSFISLKDIAGAAGGNLEVVPRKMGRNLWSDDGFQFIH